jgi:hypothetical protein
MFWSSPSADIQMMVFLLLVSLVIAGATYFFSKKVLLSVFILLALSNIILFDNLTYRIANAYNILWSFKFVRNIFPYINGALFVLLIVTSIKTKYVK